MVRLLKQIFIFTLALWVGWGSLLPSARAATLPLPDGQYPVQQATYDDGDGSYRLMLLNTPAGQGSVITLDQLPMARLGDEAIAQGEKARLTVEKQTPVLYLSEDFRIEYVHNVPETPSTQAPGQPQTVIVHRESSFWTPFAGALAGQMVGNLLFSPHYYVPPVYQPGVPLVGYGGYGTSYGAAVRSYQKQYRQAPAAIQNQQRFRSTGQFNRPGQSRSSNLKSSGSGFGSSNLRTSNGETPRRIASPNRFGSGVGSRGMSRGFSRRR